MICNTIGLTADSFESIYTTGGTEVEEVYGAINYAQPIYAKIREMTGTSPLTFTSRTAGTLTDYRISGETLQDGTPSPDYPVAVQGVGERTENLCGGGESFWHDGYYINPMGEPQSSYGSSYIETYSDYISVVPNQTLTFSHLNEFPGAPWDAWRGVAFYDVNDAFISRTASQQPTPLTVVVPNNAAFCRVTFRTHGMPKLVMLTEGSTPPNHYIPYGYKLPLTVTNGTDTVITPVYIGNEPLFRFGKAADCVSYEQRKIIRKIGKYEMTGTENFMNYANVAFYLNNMPGFARATNVGYGVYSNNTIWTFMNSKTGFNDANAFKSNLAAQYAAGTPITVWYELPTPIEEDPPVPFPALPTLSGTNTMSVDTTVKPSQMYIKGKIKPDGYGKLVDKNGVYILDKDGVQLTVHGQGTPNA